MRDCAMNMIDVRLTKGFVSMGHPTGHWDRISSHVSGQDVLPTSQHPDQDILEYLLSQVLGWDGGASRSMKNWDSLVPQYLKPCG